MTPIRCKARKINRLRRNSRNFKTLRPRPIVSLSYSLTPFRSSLFSDPLQNRLFAGPHLQWEKCKMDKRTELDGNEAIFVLQYYDLISQSFRLLRSICAQNAPGLRTIRLIIPQNTACRDLLLPLEGNLHSLAV